MDGNGKGDGGDSMDATNLSGSVKYTDMGIRIYGFCYISIPKD